MNLKDKNTLVIGLGKSGLAAAMLLLAQGACVSVYDESDKRSVAEKADYLNEKGAQVHLGALGLDLTEYDLCVVSPGIDLRGKVGQRLREAKLKVISEIELAAAYFNKPIIAVTGTNGKSTTTELIECVLGCNGMRVVACGNIGKPFAEVVLEEQGLDAVVLEVSSFQLETIDRFRPSVAVFLNLTPDHLDRYDSLDAYYQAKLRIFDNQQEEDVAIMNASLGCPRIKSQKLLFSSEGKAADYYYQSKELFVKGGGYVSQAETSLQGPHNAENQLAMIATAQWLGVEDSVIKKALRKYRPLAHRCEVVEVVDGIVYVNDSKATNVDAMKKAILAQEGQVVLIAGGKDKGFGFESVRDVAKQKLARAVLIGETSQKIRDVWQGVVECEEVDSLEEAVATAKKYLATGGVVLFSPGCSSFDMFRSFEDRGNQFAKIVKQIPGVRT